MTIKHLMNIIREFEDDYPGLRLNIRIQDNYVGIVMNYDIYRKTAGISYLDADEINNEIIRCYVRNFMLEMDGILEKGHCNKSVLAGGEDHED